jgi:hypothetical protein
MGLGYRSFRYLGCRRRDPRMGRVLRRMDAGAPGIDEGQGGRNSRMIHWCTRWPVTEQDFRPGKEKKKSDLPPIPRQTSYSNPPSALVATQTASVPPQAPSPQPSPSHPSPASVPVKSIPPPPHLQGAPKNLDLRKVARLGIRRSRRRGSLRGGGMLL